MKTFFSEQLNVFLKSQTIDFPRKGLSNTIFSSVVITSVICLLRKSILEFCCKSNYLTTYYFWYIIHDLRTKRQTT